MTGYEERFSAEFGRTVPGIFTDEPHIRQPNPTRNDSYGTIKFTPDLYNQFKSGWGYDLQNHLPFLFDEIGNWQQARYRFSLFFNNEFFGISLQINICCPARGSRNRAVRNYETGYNLCAEPNSYPLQVDAR